jgi:hypothetical protein
MIRKASKRKNTYVAVTIMLISVVTITAVLTSCFSQSNFWSYSDTIIGQESKQPSLPLTEAGISETINLNETNLIYNSSSVQLNADPVSLDASKFNSCSYGGYSVEQPNMTQLYFSFSDNINLDENPRSDAAPSINTINLENSNFVTYTYCGYPVQQPENTEFKFSFPDNTNQGQMSGSDALTLNSYPIQKIDFNATFVAPKISALGFDEMAIFATSNTITYKETEFGIRLDLKDGFVYGYVQEPNGNAGDVNFQMLSLAPNDGIIHHYTLIDNGAGISFFIDGVDHGYLNFPCNKDYSNLTFSILAVVHRFTDNWDSNGDNMIVGNFSLNQ